MADAFKALADPTRRRILELLAQGELSAGEILKAAGLISDERRGQNIVYSVNLTIFQELVKWFYDVDLVKEEPDNEK